MEITVGIPAFNEETSIEKTVRSVMRQSLPNGTAFTLIVVDDGSTDQTPQIVGHLAEEYPNIILLSQPRWKGKPSAWNRIRDHAKTDYIIFTDADVLICRNAFSSLLETARANPKLLAVGGVGVRLKRRGCFLHFINTFPYRFPRERVITGNLYLIKKSAIRKIPDTIINEDDFITETIGRSNFTIDDRAIAHICLPQTLKDYVRQKVRIYCGKHETAQMFHPRRPASRILSALPRLSPLEFLYLPGYVLVHVYSKAKARMKRNLDYQDIWKPIDSGKV